MTASTASPLAQQAIALAGVAQAARLVEQTAKAGSCPDTFLRTSINSLFVFEQDRAEDIFGGLPGIRLGLDNLASLLLNRSEAGQADTVRYLFNLLHLERQFARDQAMMSVVRSRLEHTGYRSEHFETSLNALCHSVSGIYQDTLSTLRFRIQVTGSAEHLQQRECADRVRALLLAGVRSAFLWRQLGGRRWKLLLQRRRLGLVARDLARDLHSAPHH